MSSAQRVLPQQRPSDQKASDTRLSRGPSEARLSRQERVTYEPPRPRRGQLCRQATTSSLQSSLVTSNDVAGKAKSLFGLATNAVDFDAIYVPTSFAEVKAMDDRRKALLQKSRGHAWLARAPASQLLPHGGAAHREESDHGDLRDALRLRRRAHAQRPVGVHLQLGGDVGQLDPHDVHHRLLPELLLQPALCAARPRAMAHTRASASRRRPPHPRPPARHLSRATRAPAARPQTSSTSRRAAAAAASSRRAC